MGICIFPGTFNPIHEGHIKMAEFALEKYKFKKIIFIPAYIPPQKEIDKKLAKHRFEMVKLAIKNNPKFEISDIEYQNDEKSYSIITVKKLIEQYSINERLNFIIGADAFAKIESWHKAEELRELVHFIVFPRKGYNMENLEKWDYEITNMNFIDISSTEIRAGKDIADSELERYVKEHGLYKV